MLIVRDLSYARCVPDSQHSDKPRRGCLDRPRQCLHYRLQRPAQEQARGQPYISCEVLGGTDRMFVA
jgi:hypothetical protein